MGETEMKKMAFSALVILSLFVCVSQLLSQESLLDSSFQIGGGANGPVNAILIQKDGRILVGGEFTIIAGHTNAYLARLDRDGQFDTSFGSGTDGIVNYLLQQPDGKILVGGQFTNLQGVARHSLGRLLTNDLVDVSFDTGTNLDPNEITRTICLQSDGRIVTASERPVSPFLISRVSRFDSVGQLDTSFARTFTASHYILALLPLADGTIMAGGGFQYLGSSSYSALALLRNDGEVDTNVVHVLTNYSTVISLTELTNGNILVGGSLNLAGLDCREAVAQLTRQWVWNTNFDADEFGGSVSGGYVRAVSVQADAKLIVAGDFYEVGGYWRRHFARLDKEGHVDPCFDPGLGLGGFDGARALAQQGDGRVLVGGSFDSRDGAGVENLARLLPQGECGVMRAYLFRSGGAMVAAGTCPPGGVNLLQMSTNFVDWETLDQQDTPYVYSAIEGTRPKAFFRVKKSY